MKYTFQHFVDISTSADSMQIIRVNAGGEYLMQRCRHLLGTYKYMKLGRIQIKMIPASTLPVDPLGLSYADDDPQTVDPRDQLNPGLVRITNGEDFDIDLSGVDANGQQIVYENMMMDPRWSKFMLQSGFKRSAVPLYWNVGQLHQDAYPGSKINIPLNNQGTPSTATLSVSSANTSDIVWGSHQIPYSFDAFNSDPRGLFQTGHRGRFSWMPTDMMETDAQGNRIIGLNPVPNPNVITCILPKMHKTNYYYRLFITETVYFAGIKNVGLGNEQYNLGLYEYRGLDNFAYATMPIGAKPTNPEFQIKPPGADPPNTGGSL